MKSYALIALVALLILSVGPAVAQTTGTDVFQLSKIQGLTMTGAPDSGSTAQCVSRYHALLGQMVQVHYQINPSTGIMIAAADFEGSRSLLHPLGLARQYAFMSDGVPGPWANLGITRALFSVNLQFQDAQFCFLARLDSNAQCKISGRLVSE